MSSNESSMYVASICYISSIAVPPGEKTEKTRDDYWWPIVNNKSYRMDGRWYQYTKRQRKVSCYSHFVNDYTFTVIPDNQ